MMRWYFKLLLGPLGLFGVAYLPSGAETDSDHERDSAGPSIPRPKSHQPHDLENGYNAIQTLRLAARGLGSGASGLNYATPGIVSGLVGWAGGGAVAGFTLGGPPGVLIGFIGGAAVTLFGSAGLGAGQGQCSSGSSDAREFLRQTKYVYLKYYERYGYSKIVGHTKTLFSMLFA